MESAIASEKSILFRAAYTKLEFKTARRARNLPSCNGEWCRSWMDLASTAL